MTVLSNDDVIDGLATARKMAQATITIASEAQQAHFAKGFSGFCRKRKTFTVVEGGARF